MRKTSIVILFFIIFSICFLEISNLFANPFIVQMISATPTGNRREVTRSIRTIWEYEIKVEWVFTNSSYPDTPLDLYVSSSPNALQTGNIAAYDVDPYACDPYYDDLYGGILYYLYYKYFDWELEGTWYYQAEHAVDEVHTTVPKR
jgi:hypothetical protein